MNALLRVYILSIATTLGISSASAEILVVDSLQERVLLVSSSDGQVLNDSLVSDSGRLQTPVNAIDSGRGTIFISDQLSDSVFEYGLDGSFVGTVVDSSQVDNIRGIAVRNNALYVTVASGTFSNSIQRFDLSSGTQQTFASQNLSSPWDITFRTNDFLVSNSGTDRIERFALDGTWVETLVDGTLTLPQLNFPQQININANNNLLVGGFSLPSNLYEFTEDGILVDTYLSGLGVRGAIQLDNGNYLFSAGTRLGIVDPTTGDSFDVINDLNSNFRFLERSSVTAIPEPTTLTALLAGCGLIALRARRRHRRR